MGTVTFLKELNPAEPVRAGIKPPRSFDLPLLVAVLALVIFGLVMLFSASWDYSLIVYKDPMYMFTHQLMWLGVGLVGAVLLAFFDYHHWRRMIVSAMVLTISLLVLVLFVNEIRLGATRALFGGSVQPSELAKLITIIYLAVWLYAKRDMLHDVQLGLLPLGVILGVIGGLIYQQPDLSAAATVMLLGGLLFFLSGGDLKQIGVLLLVAVAAAWLVVQISPTGHERVNDFVAGIKDPTQASYHVRRSFEAIVNGGWFGAGIGNSTSKLTGLPFPPTDSIFAVIAEELGLFGCVLLMGLYALLVWRGFVIARRAPDMLGTMLATGLVIWIGMEALINMSVMVGLLPFAGNTLPFVCSGGSNLVSSLAAVGILMNISRQHGESPFMEEEEWRSFGAVSDLRGWNRRRSVSRPRRAQRARSQSNRR